MTVLVVNSYSSFLIGANGPY